MTANGRKLDYAGGNARHAAAPRAEGHGAALSAVIHFTKSSTARNPAPWLVHPAIGFRMGAARVT